MKSSIIIAFLGATSTAFASITTRQTKGKLPPVEIKGNAFFANGQRFYVRGVAYQPGASLQILFRVSTEVLTFLRWRVRRKGPYSRHPFIEA